MRERGNFSMSNNNDKETNFDVPVSADRDNIDLLRPRRPLSSIRRYPPPKTTLCAVSLLVISLILFISGLVVFFHAAKGGDSGLPIFVLGTITWRGWRGYSYDMIPSYDD